MRLSMKPSIVPATSYVTYHKQHCPCALKQQVNFNTTRQYNLGINTSKTTKNYSLRYSHSSQPTLQRLGGRWMEYQGAMDWVGLLDPLDSGLRAEILRYGDFVEAAYRAFDFDPSSPSYGACKYSKKSLLEESGLPCTGYRLTRNLRATSGIQLPDWAKAAQSSWAAMQSSWIGYVAVCQERSEIDRLGRRDVVIALRGTATCFEWLENLRATLTKVPCTIPGEDNVGPMVESGFLSLYTSSTKDCPSLQDTLRSEVRRILDLYPNEPLSFTITGHSLGAALATLAAYDIKTTFDQAPLVTVMSFGGPRVGNQSFRCLVENQGTKILRIVNPNDLITKVPGFVIDNNNHNDGNNNNSSYINKSNNHPETRPMVGFWPSWLQKRVQDTQWVYAEVGCELRLTMEEPQSRPPYYLSNMNFAKCHDLKTYLELVKAKCPLRTTAKKLLNKQAHHPTTSHNQTSPAVM